MEKARLLYFFDPLCGWCYGFSATMKKVEEFYSDDFQIEVYSGGMIRGERVGMLSAIADYIKESLGRVEEMSGVRFGEAFKQKLNGDGDLFLSSDPPSKALAVIKKHFPEKALKYAEALQALVYEQGKNSDDREALADLAHSFGMEKSAFIQEWESEDSLKWAEEDYYMSHSFGVQGYPALIAEAGGQYYLIAKGFRDYSSLQPILEELKNKHFQKE